MMQLVKRPEDKPSKTKNKKELKEGNAGYNPLPKKEVKPPTPKPPPTPPKSKEKEEKSTN
jgi:hypothetical protein